METRRSFFRSIAASVCRQRVRVRARGGDTPCASAAAARPQRPYRILVTNDDGVRAPGILAVAQALQSLGEITIAAPAENQSGKGAFDRYVRSDLRGSGHACRRAARVFDRRDARDLRESRRARAHDGAAGPRRVRHQSWLQPGHGDVRVGHGRCRSRGGADGHPGHRLIAVGRRNELCAGGRDRTTGCRRWFAARPRRPASC